MHMAAPRVVAIISSIYDPVYRQLAKRLNGQRVFISMGMLRLFYSYYAQ